MARSEAYDRYPQHTLQIDEERLRARVRVGATLLAETERGLRLREGTYPPVVYIPRDDVRMDRLVASPHSTHCPFKGDARYFDFGADASSATSETPIAQVAWSYEDPFDQMIEIKDCLAFYADRATIEIDGD